MGVRNAWSTSRRRAPWLAAAAVLPLVLAAGCGKDKAATIASVQTERAQVVITPQSGATGVRPDLPIRVQVTRGEIRSVTVRGGHGPQPEGTLSADRSAWQSLWTLAPATRYTVTATVVDTAGRVTTATSQFTTLQPRATFHAIAVAPYDGEKVGVGMPILLNFDRPVYNRAYVERALEVRMSKPVEGAWRWISTQAVYFRPRNYWPTGEKVELIAHMTGVRGARDVYGDRDLRLHFTVAHRLIATVNAQTHHMIVKLNGRTVRDIPVSVGRGGVYKYTTTSGIHLTMDKHNPVEMISPGISKGQPGYYDEWINYAVRISDSGEYIHSMPSTVWAQGHTNVSHGCVNASPTNAKWFYDLALPGDVVIITGTNRPLEWNNGWGFWQMPWSTWVKGSALHRVINATPTPAASALSAGAAAR